MDPNKLSHDSRLNTRCPSCGGDQGTRDHVPAKVFLDEPYPDNLPVVAMCEGCNNGPSKDEEYLACMIECMVSGSTDPAKMNREKVRRILTGKRSLRRLLEESCRDEGGGQLSWTLKRERVDRVLLKMARGLAAYDLADTRAEAPDSFLVNTLSHMTKEQRDAFENVPEQHVLPEVGTRAFEREAIVVHFQINGGEPQPLPLSQLSWIEIQPDRYRYAIFHAGGLTVRLVLSEYLACEVRWD